MEIIIFISMLFLGILSHETNQPEENPNPPIVIEESKKDTP